MGKAQRLTRRKDRSTPKTRPISSFSSQGKSSSKVSKPKKSRQIYRAAPSVPFQNTDRILLVGEGDFSFSKSLLVEHCCVNLDATSLDTYTNLLAKYPQAEHNIKDLQAGGCTIIHGVDATKVGKTGVSGNGGKKVRKGNYDWVIFNFPHVGGLTKDVNRQVRHNQGETSGLACHTPQMRMIQVDLSRAPCQLLPICVTIAGQYRFHHDYCLRGRTL